MKPLREQEVKEPEQEQYWRKLVASCCDTVDAVMGGDLENSAVISGSHIHCLPHEVSFPIFSSSVSVVEMTRNYSHFFCNACQPGTHSKLGSHVLNSGAQVHPGLVLVKGWHWDLEH